MTDRMPLLLATAYIGALAWIVYEWQREPLGLEAMPASESVDLAPLRLPSVNIGDIETFEEIVARPPFTPGRRLVEQDNNDGAEQAELSPKDQRQQLKTMRVSAILVEDDQMTALVERGDGSALTLREGNKLDGWRVDRIKDDRVVLALGGRQREMLVYRFGPAPDMKSTRRGTDSAGRSRRTPNTQKRAAPRDGPRS